MDIEELLACLNDHKVRYVVIGATASRETEEKGQKIKEKRLHIME